MPFSSMSIFSLFFNSDGTMYLPLATADVLGAGRFNLDCITQQMAMEMLCAEVHNLAAIQDAEGAFIEVEHWNGLKFDGEGNITEIDFAVKMGFDLFDDDVYDQADDQPKIGDGGSMDLQWIPQSVTSFNVFDVELEGSIDTLKLPRGLEKFDISFNDFRGEFVIAGLPDSLQNLSIEYNALSGSFVIADLPRGLIKMNAFRNIFEGEIILEDLPPRIVEFSVGMNLLCGEISLRWLPASLKELNIRGNNFGQDVLVANVAGSCAYMQIEKERFGKIVDEDGKDMSINFAS